MKFELVHTDKYSKARAGVIYTDHGAIQTPIFMPVGTLGTVKAVHQRELKQDIRAQIILGNTYHLYLRPGLDVISKAGGLHKFINWNRPILTDSGGFQVYSLASMRKLTRDGVKFRSHIDGSYHIFTPEKNVDIQRVIGADIIMALDECPPYTSDYEYVKKSLELTEHWLERGYEYFLKTKPLYGHGQAFFPIVQGGVYEDLRIRAAQNVIKYDTIGYAHGGLAVGEPTEKMYQLIELVNNILPKNKARYLMGVGTPQNILESIQRGIDMFDCVMPTRNGRNAMLFTRNGIINIRNQKWKYDFSPLEHQSDIFVDKEYSKAYLRHLFIVNERLAAQIASIHNLGFYMWLVREARKNILKNTFVDWKNKILPIITKRL